VIALPDTEIGEFPELLEDPTIQSLLQQYADAVFPLMSRDVELVPDQFGVQTTSLSLVDILNSGKEPQKGESGTPVRGDWLKASQALFGQVKEAVEAALGMEVIPRQRNFSYRGRGITWHTNSDFPGRRIYFVGNLEAGSSTAFARVEKGSTDLPDVEHLVERQGWQCHSFVIPEGDQRLWHAVRAQSLRVSIGFTTS